ncbi:hypothetical protein CGCF415_v001285 [Colletotrichum fructicola]|nr:hypothetical protein CGCF415_v001285 [Colletotrichum fructicola]KAF4942933.1 hypothetical protein CGCF245_v000131 [Colletotrichum fructicola]KAF5498297.1 hypothetical protein CGCF413_v006788 [Colletotrichum fructicola]
MGERESEGMSELIRLEGRGSEGIGIGAVDVGILEGEVLKPTVLVKDGDVVFKNVKLRLERLRVDNEEDTAGGFAVGFVVGFPIEDSARELADVGVETPAVDPTAVLVGDPAADAAGDPAGTPADVPADVPASEDGDTPPFEVGAGSAVPVGKITGLTVK